MRSPALSLTCSLVLAAPVFGQILSWEDIDKKKAILNQATEEARKIKAEPADDIAERAAYVKLGQALTAHPEMATHNQALKTAKQKQRDAVATGDTAQISAAQSELAAVMTARYNKASSIPELKKLIEEWQAAALGITPDTKPSPEVEKNMQQIQSMLEQLQDQLGR